jgi:SAM-dependent methyltransferase
MNETPDQAIQIRILNRLHQAYLQQQPFAAGGDPRMNAAVLEDLRHSLRFRPAGTPPVTKRGDPADAALTDAEKQRIEQWFERLGTPQGQRDWAWRALAWKISRIPRTTKSVLSLGCGGGVELILIRALLPQARLVAVDFQDAMPTAVKQALWVEFTQGHILDYLARCEERFDAVFCNHFLEHLYEPEPTLAAIYKCLNAGGGLYAGLPMDGCADSVFARELRTMVANADSLHPLDVGVLDAGHAWKTNPADLHQTLRSQGFSKVELHVRRQSDRTVRRRVGETLYAATFGTGRSVVRGVFGRQVPHPVLKGFLALERRCWFGANRLKNSLADEVLVTAGL